MITNGERARRWYAEVWGPGGEATVRELMAPDAVGQMEGADVDGPEAFLAERNRLLQVFPDLKIVTDDIIEAGDKVAIRWRVTATHLGDGLGIAPTKRPVAIRGMTWMEFRNGRMVRAWDSWNLGGLLQTLAAPQ